MENLRRAGKCAYCGDEPDRLFDPPWLQPPDWYEVEEHRPGYAWWHVPGQGYPGKDLYRVVEKNNQRYLRGYETPDEPICWLCFDGHTPPAERDYLVNRPVEIQFNGWEQPSWTDSQSS